MSPIRISPRVINPRSRDTCGRRGGATLRDWELYYPTGIGALCKQHYRVIHLSIGTSDELGR